MVDHDHITDLLPAYALGCLDSDESVLVSDHIAACEICHTRLMAYRQSVDLLANGAPGAYPPDTLKSKLMQRVGANTDIPDKLDQPPSQWRRAFSRPRFFPIWAITSLILIVGLAVINLQQWQTASRSFQTEAAGELLIIKMKGTPRAPEGDGTFVVSQDRRQGVLVASDLPVLDESHRYQLWMVKNGQRLSGGLFTVSVTGYATEKFYAKELLTNFRSFEVSVEPTGGSPKPGDYLVLVSRQ
ncbi:hypothetical protein D1BOALGB6SA_7263 [Olavius sp. associated proteobacterium Delta 1]|nr:hypothetical protein D1BOALGB6SA_7263 [Olavius sp. associated proteobacterium Delta 1]